LNDLHAGSGFPAITARLPQMPFSGQAVENARQFKFPSSLFGRLLKTRHSAKQDALNA
jgi:hypothetical protein